MWVWGFVPIRLLDSAPRNATNDRTYAWKENLFNFSARPTRARANPSIIQAGAAYSIRSSYHASSARRADALHVWAATRSSSDEIRVKRNWRELMYMNPAVNNTAISREPS